MYYAIPIVLLDRPQNNDLDFTNRNLVHICNGRSIYSCVTQPTAKGHIIIGESTRFGGVITLITIIEPYSIVRGTAR